jgi:hypothetical protein
MFLYFYPVKEQTADNKHNRIFVVCKLCASDIYVQAIQLIEFLGQFLNVTPGKI